MPVSDNSCKSKFLVSEKRGKKRNLQFQSGSYDSKTDLTKPNRLKHWHKASKMAVNQPFPMQKGAI
jgi:hypothetical protein